MNQATKEILQSINQPGITVGGITGVASIYGNVRKRAAKELQDCGAVKLFESKSMLYAVSKHFASDAAKAGWTEKHIGADLTIINA